MEEELEKLGKEIGIEVGDCGTNSLYLSISDDILMIIGVGCVVFSPQHIKRLADFAIKYNLEMEFSE